MNRVLCCSFYLAVKESYVWTLISGSSLYSTFAWQFVPFQHVAYMDLVKSLWIYTYSHVCIYTEVLSGIIWRVMIESCMCLSLKGLDINTIEEESWERNPCKRRVAFISKPRDRASAWRPAGSAHSDHPRCPLRT